MSNDTKTTHDALQDRNDLPDSLADSWIDFLQSPEDTSAQNRFANELNTLVRRFHTRASLIEPLRNLSEDLCQEANLLLLSKLLAGNQELIAATCDRNRAAISGQLRRSVSAALRFSKWKLIKSLSRSLGEFQPEQDRGEAAIYQHPANVTKLCDFSIEFQQKLVMEMLHRAVNDLALTSDSAELARHHVINNLTQADIARSLGVTRQAVCQRLAPVWRYLRKALNDQEFPLS